MAGGNAYLGLIPSDLDPELPGDTGWYPVDQLPETAFDHGAIILAGRERLRAKLSYANIGFALAPRSFSISQLRDLYAAALGHESRRRTCNECCYGASCSSQPERDVPRAPAAAARRRSSASARTAWRSPTSSRCSDHLFSDRS